METGEDFAVDKQQRHAHCRQYGRQEAHQALGHDDKRQGEQNQQIGGKHQEAEMPDKANVGVNASRKRRRPVGDKKIATTEHHGQQHVEQGEPVPPANHLGDFFSVRLTMSHHKLLLVPLVRRIAVNRRLQRLGKRARDSLALSRSHAAVNQIGDHIPQHHQRQVGWSLMFFQYVGELAQQLFNVFITIAGLLWHKSKSVHSLKGSILP